MKSKLWYRTSQSMISVTPDIIDLWYHNQYHMQNHIWYHEIKTMPPGAVWGRGRRSRRHRSPSAAGGGAGGGGAAPGAGEAAAQASKWNRPPAWAQDMSVGERKSRISRWSIREKKYGQGKSITTEVKKRKWLWKSAGSPTNQENQLVTQPEETDDPNE